MKNQSVHQLRKQEWDQLKQEDKVLYRTIRDGKREFNNWRRHPFNPDGTPKMQQGGFAPQPLKLTTVNKKTGEPTTVIVPYIKRTKYTRL